MFILFSFEVSGRGGGGGGGVPLALPPPTPGFWISAKGPPPSPGCLPLCGIGVLLYYSSLVIIFSCSHFGPRSFTSLYFSKLLLPQDAMPDMLTGAAEEILEAVAMVGRSKN